MVIYQIMNLITEDLYVGQTSFTAEQRFANHCANARWNRDTYLYRAMRKYGVDKFVVSVLEEVTPEEADAKECYWIASLGSVYNMTAGGTGGDTSASERYRYAISIRDQSGPKNGMFGRKGTESPNYGKRRTDDQKARMKQALKSRWNENHSRREALSKSMMGLNAGAKKNAKPIVFEGQEYCSIADASRRTGKSIGFIKKKGYFIECSTLDGGLPPQDP